MERERDSMEGTEHAEISSFPSRFFSPLSPQSWHYQKDGILDIMCHVKSSYAFRTVKLLFILGARREERKKSGGRKRERERAKNRGEWQADVTIWPPRIHYGQNYQVITALVAKTRRLYKCKRMRECFWFNDASPSLTLSFVERQSKFCDRRNGRFSSATKDILAFEIRSFRC